MISIVIPVFNEEESITEFYQRLKNVVKSLPESFELIFVDDGSTDTSPGLLKAICDKEPGARFIRLSRNFGHQLALTAGLDHARGDAVIMMDSDLQHPPELIPELIGKWKEGYEIVYTVRNSSKDYTLTKKLTSSLFYRLLSRISNLDIQEGAADFRLLSKPAALSLQTLRERTRFIRGLVDWVGFKKVSLSYVADARFAGKSKYSLKKMIRFALSGITSFSSMPLYISAVLGLGIAAFSFFYALGAIYARFFTHRTIPGWTSILVSVLFLGGVQLIAIGILGEYLAKIYDEVKQRPLYIIQEMKGFNEKK